MKKNKIRKILAFMLALALMVSCMPSAYTISASEAFGDGTEDIFTDGESASVPAAEEETTDVGSADQEEPAQQTTLTYEDDSVKVTAEALEEGALPQNTTLKADAVNENSSVFYDTVSQKLAKAAEDKGSSLRGFSAYDVYFADADGNRAELNGRAKITIEYKNPSAPELTDVADTSVTAVKLHYNGSNGETEVGILQPDEELKVLNVSESKQLQTLQMETSNTAVWAVMWDSPEVEATASNEEEIATEAETVGETETSETENTETPEQPEENAEVTEVPEEDAEVTEAPEEDAEVTEAPEEDAEVTEAPEEDAEITETPSADAESKITILEVIADNTNLRISPSTEAEIVTTVAAGTQLTALETVTAEDGTTWYKVSFNETEGYVRSDLVKVVENADDSEEEDSLTDELQQEDTVTYTKEVDNVVITATAAQGVLPEDAELVVNAIEKDNSQYSEVAEKLEEKAKAEEYSIAGFLAYDIFFTDKDGNKIEPQDGKVKVSMAYTKAAIPEEVANQADNAGTVNESDEAQVSDGTDSDSAVENGNVTQQYEVSLMHLSEDDNGQVKEVVDMTGAGQGNVETTADSEVTRAEFETESFSAFTIIWKVGNTNYTLSVHRMLEKADGTLEEDSSTTSYAGGNLSNADSVTLSKLGDSYGIDGYIYSYGYVVNTSGEKKNATKISYNNYGQGQSGENWWYEKDSSDQWEVYATGKTSDVYLVYKPTYLSTVDSKKDGITVNLFNYNDTKVNSGHALQFVRTSGDGINAWTGGAKPNQGIMKNLLGKDADGNYTYPVLSSNSEGTSYLFSPTDTTAKTNYTDLNKLFTKDADGYYEYNSANNYAYLDGSEFKVYSIPGTTTEAQGTSGGKNVGGFFPFNPLPSGSDEIISGIRNIETGTNKATRVDLFGMTMSAEFIQPEDGEVNGKDMEFTFSGDDDVWVYIDGVLVLDIGGIHDAVSGTINFKTGAVTVDSKNDTTLKALFEAAGVSTENFNGNTFSDYTGHTINFYYLERGSYASNCHLKFNLSTIPESSIAVEKQLSNTDKEKYANVEFKFQVLAQEISFTDPISGKETYSDTYVALHDAVLNDENSTPVTFKQETINGETYDNVFTLKAGQRAIFKGLKKTRKYKVREIGVKTTEYDHVYINKAEITVTDKDGNQISSGATVGNIASGEATVGSRPLVIFTNNCSSANSRELQITKKIKNDTTVTDKFDFKVQLNGLDYTGTYYLKDSAGNYYIKGENGTLMNKGTTSEIYGTAKNGVISSVPAGYTAVITQILSGTKFTVEEVNLNTREYDSPSYKVDNADPIKTDSVAEGTIKLGNDAKVTVTNTPSNVAELVFKKVNTNGEILPGAEFTLTSKDDTTKTYQATADKDGLVKFENLFSGTYTLTETKVPDGYENRNTWIVKVEKNEDGNAVATLYETDGTTEIQKEESDGYYHIVNYTHQELIESDIEYSKTAYVTDWEKREYQIDISAASRSVSTTTETRSSDVVLVLDVSGSMDEAMGYTYVGTNTAETRAALDTSKTNYYLKSGNTYYQMRYSDNAWWITASNGRWNTDYNLNSNYSGYEIYSNSTRLDALKESVEAFITSLAQKSPNSRVGITAFSSNYYNDTINGKTQDMVTVGANKDALISFVKSLTAKGGTIFAGTTNNNQRTGLYRAKDLLDGVTNNSSNNVILFTDGAPTGDNTGDNPEWDSNVVSTANQAAKDLKDAGYNVYTIGFALTDQANAFLAGGTYGSTTYPGIASSADCAKTANDAASLSEIFRTIEQTITNDIDITNATITDTIDPRFDLLDDNGNVITEASLKNGTLTLKNGGVVSLVDGNWQVQWTKVTIPNKNKQAAWSRSIKVKAKDTYIGGNDVTTNVAEGSNIRFGDEKVDLPQPKVNVNVKIFIKDKEVTIYKGDTVPTEDEILKQLFDERDKTSYANGKVGNADIDKVELHWYTDPECTNEVTVEQMATQPDADTHYYLKVTYNAGDPSGESNSNTTLNGKTYVAGGSDKIQEATNPDNNNNPYGIYTIHVISGEIDIVKKVSETSSEPREFQFNVTKDGNAVEGSPFTVTVPANSDTGTLSEDAKAKLSKLPRGTYVVTEAVPSGYKITATDTNGTDCEVSTAENAMTFILGNGISTKSNVILTDYTYNSADGGVLGKATYTNEYSTDLDLKKISSDNNSALSGAKFKLEVKENSTWKSAGEAYNSFEVNNNDNAVELKDLKPGLYKLTEIEAPKGYTLLSDSIYFQVSGGRAALTDENGNFIGDQSMWTLAGQVLTIKNTKIYTLPSAGGPGIYGFTISGVAILATALLLFINNKRREEEAEKS